MSSNVAISSFSTGTNETITSPPKDVSTISSSAPSIKTIEGLSYQVQVSGRGTVGYIDTQTFIPSRNLVIHHKNGRVFSSEEPCTSIEGDKAIKKYLQLVNDKKQKYDHTELKEIMDNANKSAQKKVALPLEFVDKLESLAKENVDLNGKMESNNKTIAELTKKFFVNT